MSQWAGCSVSIKCADRTYQGEISSATNSHIILSKAFCDGIPSKTKTVMLVASDILDLKLIEKQPSPSTDQSTILSTVPISKPLAKRAARSQSLSENASAQKNGTNTLNRSKPIDIQTSVEQVGQQVQPSLFQNKTLTPTSKNKNKLSKYNAKSWKDEACFGQGLEESYGKDFDFEKNLALFNKQAVFEEIDSRKPDVLKSTDNKKNKYRHDENVIAKVPTILRQIAMPKSEVAEYVTDAGLIIPTISRVLRKKLWAAAEHVGLNWDRRVELMGRAATEMAVQLLGGAHRLNPQNQHQCPTVVFLCGPHRQGAVGINAARQLAGQGVRTIVYSIPSETEINAKELNLYKLTKNQAVSGLQQFPSNVDLIIVALCEDGDNMKLYGNVADKIMGNRAPILALDPPSSGTPGITAKFSLVPVLPLAHSTSNGKIYLCNLGFPIEIFNEVGIRYKSPFGPKFVIPLHTN